ncbi:patatin-like phospholipase family protein [Sediminitomix flava]|nr:patatin-like phospholipase family protein [Sediminitomix flava]
MRGKKYKLGLALSGGGAKGLAHIGIIKYLVETERIPEIIAGTSAGSLVGTLFAAGNSIEKIQDFFYSNSLFSWSYFSTNQAGLIDPAKLRKLLEPYFPEDNFEALQIPVKIVATDMLQGKVKVFEEGSVIDSVLASIAYPFVFAPMKIGNTIYSDGGILNHFPADLIHKDCKKLIGVYVSPDEQKTEEDLKNVRQIVIRAMELMGVEAERKKFDLCHDMFYMDELLGYTTFDTRNEILDEIIDIGYQSAKSHYEKDHVTT